MPVPRPSVWNFSTDLPRGLAGEVVGIEPLGAEVGEDHLAVGGRGRAGEGAARGDGRRTPGLRRRSAPTAILPVFVSSASSLSVCFLSPATLSGCEHGLSVHRVLDGLDARERLRLRSRWSGRCDRPRRSATSGRAGSGDLPGDVLVGLPIRSAAASRSRCPARWRRATAASSRRRPAGHEREGQDDNVRRDGA